MSETTHTAQLTRTHRILIGVVIAGAVLIAAIGFTGSYAAVRELAEKKGFGAFSAVFPIGIDAGIVVLLALDLLLTWIRIPFPLLRQTAWLLTAATIAFNGAAAWPDALGVGMHAVIPVLFVVAVEAARHAVGRIADITADKHMEGVRLTRWLLAFPSTFRLWRRMKLWELRSYDQVIRLEQDRLVYQARLRARYGRSWRRRAPVESLMPLRLARYGVPLAKTAPAGLAAAGIEPPVLMPAGTGADTGTATEAATPAGTAPGPIPVTAAGADARPALESHPAAEVGGTPEAGSPIPAPTTPEPEINHTLSPEPAATASTPEQAATATQLTVPVGPGRSRPLGSAGDPLPIPEPAQPSPPAAELPPDPEQLPPVGTFPDDIPRDEAYFAAYRSYVAEQNSFPNSRQFSRYLLDFHGVTGQDGGPLSESYLRGFVRDFRLRLRMELETEHIP
ncbi:DUF2637 domain-containing protein [Streptomyces sp. NPDC050636]|uniref:DUF2637 domain-containing protein n=1 Tax=Streptomyces sp. NPDC050636 TaxID=3154510 RepID=UPI00341DF9A7